ncbi:SPOR domain-containing protein [Silvibacterium sp.]|uniref:SPOR domain-containing protein n=1 Tax=Silvibacterium sp. TaxID=1964179 RepID=UPI0039E48F3C
MASTNAASSPATASIADAKPKVAAAPASATALAPAEGKSSAAHPLEPAMPQPELAVRVGSFSNRANADALVQSLRDKGYRPAVGQFTDGHGRHWYVVKLGPYARWNTASAVAARISIAEKLSPVIGPVR